MGRMSGDTYNKKPPHYKSPFPHPPPQLFYVSAVVVVFISYCGNDVWYTTANHDIASRIYLETRFCEMRCVVFRKVGKLLLFRCSSTGVVL